MAALIGIVSLVALAGRTYAQAATIKSFPDCSSGPLSNTTVCDRSADPLTRATALVNLFTLEEKLNNTGNNSPGVPRIGLPEYEWWSEGLHGVAESPGVIFATSGNYSYATSFPQPILMSAAFDDNLIRNVATVVSTEARAFSNVGRAGLDFWTPNINPYKDPRWGRGQETPGEDPYHIGSYVRALIDGLQGGLYPETKKIIATCKHFAAYDMESWNGNYRYQWDAQISSQDLAEYYLPPFQSCARDSNVGAIMCSYNALNGVPTCADPWLLQSLLRDHWNWTSENQWVTSDCDAVQNVFLPHNYTTTREEAVAAAMNAGTDLDCGTYYQQHLPGAYAQGLLTEATLDQSLIRLYSSLVRTGYFDGPSAPYRNLTFTDVSTPYAQNLARQAATEGMVLLKNDGLLPLSLSNSTSVALIGDWANATSQMQGNYFGVAPYLHSPLYALQQLGVQVNYVQGPGGQGDPTTDSWLPVWDAANISDIILYMGGIDISVEAEGMDRNSIDWTGAQLDIIGQLAEYGKKMAVVQFGDQIDSSPLVNNPNISSIIAGFYPGQSGGDAVVDLLTGVAAPAGRLPVTQYPSHYIRDIPMTDMSLRPSAASPGRTYKWYQGTPVFEFGYGLHYTNFSVSTSNQSISNYSISSLLSNCTESYKDRCAFKTFNVKVQNTGTVVSDYVTLGFLAGAFGPQPYPKKSLVSYQRLHSIQPGQSATASLNLTLGSLGRVDDSGNTLLYPGDYALLIDTQPLTYVNFTLYGTPQFLDEWPQAPVPSQQGGDYFVGGYEGYGGYQDEEDLA